MGKLKIGTGSKPKPKNKVETERKKFKSPSQAFRAGSITKKQEVSEVLGRSFAKKEEHYRQALT